MHGCCGETVGNCPTPAKYKSLCFASSLHLLHCSFVIAAAGALAALARFPAPGVLLCAVRRLQPPICPLDRQRCASPRQGVQCAQQEQLTCGAVAITCSQESDRGSKRQRATYAVLSTLPEDDAPTSQPAPVGTRGRKRNRSSGGPAVTPSASSDAEPEPAPMAR